jgi:hypothetical protein
MAGKSYAQIKKVQENQITAEPIDAQSVKSRFTVLNNKAEIDSEATFDKLGFREDFQQILPSTGYSFRRLTPTYN